MTKALLEARTSCKNGIIIQLKKKKIVQLLFKGKKQIELTRIPNLASPKVFFFLIYV